MTTLDTNQIEDIYPLTPTQRGMLFHSLYAPGSAVYFQQEGFLVEGTLDTAAFVRAWEYVLARHPVLRTAIIWEGLDEPVQVVFRNVPLPLVREDWRDVATNEQQMRLAMLAQADRARGFNPVEAPLMRLMLIQLADTTHHVIWSRHHLLLDGWSVALLLNEVLRSYAVFRNGQQPNMPPPLPYRQYLAWLQRQNIAQAETFWRAALAGFHSSTPLGVDHAAATPAGQERYGEQWAHITPTVTAALQAFARTHRLTVNTLFQGAWALMLGCYSGQKDILFGATGSGRPTQIAGVESMAGLLINTLPVRVCVTPHAPLIPWLQQLLARQAESRHYDYSSLVDIQRWSELPRGATLFDSLLVFENFPRAFAEEAQASQLNVSSAHSFECTNYPLNLAVLPGEGLALRAIYDVDRFETATIVRMLGHLQAILQAMLADPSQQLGTISLVSNAEQQALLRVSVATQLSHDNLSIQQRFEQQVQRTPHAVALHFEQRWLTYHELNERANQLAHYLCAHGVGLGVPVGLCMERSFDLVVGLLGILKAGGACVPLDPADPFAWNAARLENAKVTLLLTQTRLVHDLPAINTARQPTIIRIDADWDAVRNQARTNPRTTTIGESVALMLPASRHIVALTHQTLWGRLASVQQVCALAQTDVVLHKAGLATDTAMWEILSPLLWGGQVVIALPEGQDDPDYLRQIIADYAVSVAHFGSAALSTALDAWRRGPRLDSLRALLYTGKSLLTLPDETWRAWLGCGVYHLYSPPEAGTYLLRRDQPARDELPTATGMYVLDDALCLLPIGVTGDVYVAGAGLAQGYVFQPIETAQAFIPHPFTRMAGERLFKSGDRGRWLNDGALELVQPHNRHVWLDGARVDVSDVTAALLHDSAIDDCAVLVRESPTGPVLVAYVVASTPLVLGQLPVRLRARLPAAWCPTAYIPLARLPLTGVGTVDEAALQQIELIDAELVQHWEKRLEAVPGIAQVAVIAQQHAEQLPALHLADLLPDWEPVAASTASVSAPETQYLPSNGTAPARLALADGGPLDIPANAPTTLADALIETAALHPDNGIVYIQTDGSAVVQRYPELLDQAQRILASLAAHGVKLHDRVILHIEQLHEYLPVFWACVLGGITPVTVVVAPAYVEHNSVVNKLYNAWAMLGQPLILTSAHLLAPLAGLSAFLPTQAITLLAVNDLGKHEPIQVHHHAAMPQDVAFLQLSSGSTGIPKVIQETHQAVISYTHASRAINHLAASDTSLNWLPIDHVGALIMFHIRDLYLGCNQIQVRTDMILAEPLTWFDLIERYNVTHTWSPNFGYKLLADRLAHEPTRTWDLSSVKEFLNGGEQVTAMVVREFLERTARFHVAPHAMQPAYGMAETSTAMTHARQFDLATSVGYFDKQSLGGALQRAAPDDPAAATFVEVGPPNPGVQIRIVDAANQLLHEGMIGRLQVKGAIISPGYLDNPSANAEAFTDDGWFYTGDLSMIVDGCLLVTGREKEVIIINGVNYYCYDIEDAVKQVAGVAATFVGVCEVDDPRSGTEGLAVCFVPTLQTLDEQIETISNIRARVVAGFGLAPTMIVPIPQDQFPKTTSGKIQRAQLKAALASGQFREILQQVDIQLRNANTLPDWFYRKIWRRKHIRASISHADTRQTLVFLDTLGLGAALGTLDRPCVSVEQGSEFARLGRTYYQIDPGNRDHYQLLLASLAHDDIQIDLIVHLWTYAPVDTAPRSPTKITQAQTVGAHSVLFLVQALNQSNERARPMQLDVVSSGVQPVLPDDALACERATVLGLIKTIPYELPWLRCRHIDLPVEHTNAACLLREIRGSQDEREVAYRHGQRLVARLEPVTSMQAPAPMPAFKPRGMYVVSGGLGGIGGVLARYLRERYDARLLLVGRTALPEWDDQHSTDSTTSEHFATLHALQQRGDVRYEALDICDVDALQAAVERAQVAWQCELDGVIHLAGVYQDQLLVEATRDSFDAMLRPKVLGTWALHQLVKDRPGSQFVSFSSVHSLFGGFNVGAYAAANSFLDTFAHYQRHACAVHSFCFAWSSWDKLGLSRDLEVGDRLEARGYATITPQQGLYALLAGLGFNQPYLAIGLDRSKPAVQQVTEAAPYQAQQLRAYFSTDSDVSPNQLQQLDVYDRLHTRSTCDFVRLQALPHMPDGTVDRQALAELNNTHASHKAVYVAPQTELERTIAAIWQHALKLENVGAHDNFFDLGGQSLLMTQVQGKLRAALKRDISMVDMFKYPTISTLASYLSQEQPPPDVPAISTDRTARQKEAIARQKQQALRRRNSGE